MTTCPTCGRTPSMRLGHDSEEHEGRRVFSVCPDPIHDAADHAPELAAALRAADGIERQAAILIYEARERPDGWDGWADWRSRAGEWLHDRARREKQHTAGTEDPTSGGLGVGTEVPVCSERGADGLQPVARPLRPHAAPRTGASDYAPPYEM